ncbi:MAG: hypothetical protein ACTSPI_00890 [Candidatus Heimdallarchaeaceae archaeon]
MKLISFKDNGSIVFVNPEKVCSLEEREAGRENGTKIQFYNHVIFTDEPIKKVQRKLLYTNKES